MPTEFTLSPLDEGESSPLDLQQEFSDFKFTLTPSPFDPEEPIQQILDEEFPGEFESKDDPGYKEFAKAAFADITVGPFVGLAEKLKILPKGMRVELFEAFQKTKEDFEGAADPRFSGHLIPGVGDRRAASLLTQGVASLIPLLPGGMLGKFAGSVVKGSGRVKRAFQGATAALPEAGLIAIGNAPVIPEEDRLAVTALTLGLGGTTGAAAAQLGSRKAAGLADGVDNFYNSVVGELPSRGERTPIEIFRAMRRSMFNSKDTLDRTFRKVEDDVGAALVDRSRKSSRIATNPVFRQTEIWSPLRQSFRKTGGSLEDVLVKVENQGVHRKEFESYLLHRSNLDTARLGKPGDLQTLQEGEKAVEGLIQKFGLEEGTKRINVLDDLADEFFDWQTRAIILPLRSINALDASSVKNLLQAHPHHVPFNSLEKALGVKGTGVARKAENLIKKRTSGLTKDSKILPPIEEVSLTAMRVSELVDKHLVKRNLLNALEIDPNLIPGVKLRAPQAVKVATLSKKELVDLGAEDLDQVTHIFRGVDKAPDNTSFITYSLDEKGNRIKNVWDAPKDVIESLENLTPFSSNLALKAAASMNKALRAGATTFSLGFISRNPLRDNIAAWVHSKNGFIPIIDPVFAATEVLADMVRPGHASQLLQEFSASGVSGATLVGLDRAAMETAQSVVRAEGKRGKLKHFFIEFKRNPLYPFQVLSEFSENSTRFAEFRLAREGGRATVAGLPILGTKGFKPPKSILQAAHDASEVSLNFSRSGKFVRGWNNYEAFVNAEFQDLDKIARGLKDPRTRWGIISRGIAGVTMPALAVWALHRDNPDYQNLPDHDKDKFLHLEQREDGSWLKIPRPIGVINALFARIPEGFVKWREGDPEGLEQISRALVDETPFGIFADPNRAASSISPTILDPLVENLFNRSFFYEREIIPRNLQEELPHTQFTASTPRTVKEIARYLQPLQGNKFADTIGLTSPLKLNNLFQGWFAAIAAETLAVSDVAIFQEPATSADPLVGSRRAPFVGSLERAFSSPPPVGFRSKEVTDFYTMLDSARLAKKRVEEASEIAKTPEDFEGLKEGIIREQPEVLILSELEGMSRNLATWRKQRKEIGELDMDRLKKTDEYMRFDEMLSATLHIEMEAWIKALVTTSMHLEEQLKER